MTLSGVNCVRVRLRVRVRVCVGLRLGFGVGCRDRHFGARQQTLRCLHCLHFGGVGCRAAKCLYQQRSVCISSEVSVSAAKCLCLYHCVWVCVCVYVYVSACVSVNVYMMSRKKNS